MTTFSVWLQVSAVILILFVCLLSLVYGGQYLTETRYRRKHSVRSELHVWDSVNDAFLRGIRARSCYPVLRAVHAILTMTAVSATGILWGVLLINATNASAGLYATFLCGLVLVALLVEYGAFRLVVDAVDVLVDMGRITVEAKSRQTAGGE